jgi:exoribonuclease R
MPRELDTLRQRFCEWFTPSRRNTFPDWDREDHPNVSRIDFSYLPLISMDPPGSTDIDDAFSVLPTTDPQQYFVYLHVADVTAYVCPSGPLFEQARMDGQTTYTVGQPPSCLFPPDRCSLTQGRPVKAITLCFCFNQTFQSISDVNVAWTWVGNRFDHRLTYDDPIPASCQLAVEVGMQVAHLLKQRHHTIDSCPSEFVMESDKVCLRMFSEAERQRKEMIAEFALFFNEIMSSMVPVKRSCFTNSRAFYHTHTFGHAPLGLQNYVHSTSPLRRFADAIVHYLLAQETIFDLPNILTHLTRMDQYHRRRQKRIQKWCLLLLISQHLQQREPVTLSGSVVHNNGFGIEQFNNVPIRIMYSTSYTIKRAIGTPTSIAIRSVSIPSDSKALHSLPEIDHWLSCDSSS